MTDPTPLLQGLSQAGFPDVADLIGGQSRAGIRLTSTRSEDAQLGIGICKLGGSPDLPEGLDWPAWQGKSLGFVAQVNLPQMAGCGVPPSLPSTGLLSYFYDVEQQAWGFDPAHVGGWRVYHFHEGQRLARREPPADVPPHGRYQACRLDPILVTTVPSPSSTSFAALGLAAEAEDAYREVYYEWAERGATPRHQLLGHPYEEQGQMQFECQLVSNGINVGDASGYDDPRWPELKPGAADWQLLLQVDTDDDAGMMWGDCGLIYYWIRRQDLEAGGFEKVHLILMCG